MLNIVKHLFREAVRFLKYVVIDSSLLLRMTKWIIWAPGRAIRLYYTGINHKAGIRFYQWRNCLLLIILGGELSCPSVTLCLWMCQGVTKKLELFMTNY